MIFESQLKFFFRYHTRKDCLTLFTAVFGVGRICNRIMNSSRSIAAKTRFRRRRRKSASIRIITSVWRRQVSHGVTFWVQAGGPSLRSLVLHRGSGFLRQGQDCFRFLVMPPVVVPRYSEPPPKMGNCGFLQYQHMPEPVMPYNVSFVNHMGNTVMINTATSPTSSLHSIAGKVFDGFFSFMSASRSSVLAKSPFESDDNCRNDAMDTDNAAIPSTGKPDAL